VDPLPVQRRLATLCGCPELELHDIDFPVGSKPAVGGYGSVHTCCSLNREDVVAVKFFSKAPGVAQTTFGICVKEMVLCRLAATASPKFVVPCHSWGFTTSATCAALSDGETGHTVSSVTIKAFLRMSLNGEVITSSMYPRMVVRLSHFVAIADISLANHVQRLPAGYEHAEVICYFMVTDAVSNDVIRRLVRIRAYKNVEDEYHGNLGVTLLARDNTLDLLVPCSTIVTKVLWYDHPDCKCVQAMHLSHQVRTGAY
jgi:hypothetical protein